MNTNELWYKQWFFDLKNWLSQYPSWVSEVLIFGVSGLVAGYIAKKIGSYFLMALLCLAIGCILFDYAGIFTFEQLFASSLYLSARDVLNQLPGLIHLHKVAVISSLVSFFFGWRLG